MNWKSVGLFCGLVVAFGVLLVAFGYFDDELDDTRRAAGIALSLAGLALVAHAAVRLASDWPRLKPRHNVDLAFVQIGLGVAVLCIACALGGRPEAFLAPLLNPTPALPSPTAATGGS